MDGLSFRRLAAELGLGASSLYRYVRSKDELIDLMADAAMAGASPIPMHDWRTDLRAVADRYRDLLRRHPWLARLPPTRPSLGPNCLDWMESAFAAAAGLQRSADEELLAVSTLLTFVAGHVAGEQADALGVTADVPSWMAAQGEYGDAIVTDGRHPALARIMIEASDPHSPDRSQQSYERGITQILDGLA